MRNMPATQATLVHSSAKGVHIGSLYDSVPNGSTTNALLNEDVRELLEMEKMLIEFPDPHDVLLAERQIDEALVWLDERENVAAETKETNMLSLSMLSLVQAAIAERIQKNS